MHACRLGHRRPLKDTQKMKSGTYLGTMLGQDCRKSGRVRSMVIMVCTSNVGPRALNGKVKGAQRMVRMPTCPSIRSWWYWLEMDAVATLPRAKRSCAWSGAADFQGSGIEPAYNLAEIRDESRGIKCDGVMDGGSMRKKLEGSYSEASGTARQPRISSRRASSPKLRP